jgi:hydroxymethylbilane synthase
MKIRLGTRSSRLARWQSESVAELLRGQGIDCELVPIETRGDDIPDRPLPEIGGDGAFTERIERALRESRIDIAVHSLKDLPIEDPGDLCVGAVLGRREVRDVLVSRERQGLLQLRAGAVVGSSSTRRQAQLLALRPDLVVRPIRGNVETRIRKVETGEFDATVLAAAGVVRLGLAEKVAEWLELSDFLPAPGQGAIAVQCRGADAPVRRLLSAIDEPILRSETDAERGFLRALGGGCSAPVGAYALRVGTRMRMWARVGALDGSRVVDVDDEGDPGTLAGVLAERALREGAADLVSAAARHSTAGSQRAAGPLSGLRVLVTRPRDQAEELCRKLAAAGASPLAVAMIATRPLEDTRRLDEALGRLHEYRWLVLASANGADAFAKRLRAVGAPAAWSKGAPAVAAVGPGTAAALASAAIPVDVVSAVHTGSALAAELAARDPRGMSGARVLMPRALEGRDEAAEILRGQGAVVDDIPIYRTEPRAPTDGELSLLDGGVDAVLFASGSAVSSWCERANVDPRLAEAGRNAAVACIGPTTASTARSLGLRVDVEAAIHTSDGLVTALGEYFSHARSAKK